MTQIDCRKKIEVPRFFPAQCAVAIVLVGLLSGCHSVKMSEPPRTAVEQLLLSTAADRAVKDVDLSWLKGRNVYVEEKYFESYDKGYAVSLIRQRISESGGLLMATNVNADVIVEIRSGALGMSTAETLIGIPAMGLPVPLAGALQTPELALYKSQKGDSAAKFALFAYERSSGEHIRSAGAMAGRAYFHLYKIVGISWKRTDVPELSKHPKPASPSEK